MKKVFIIYELKKQNIIIFTFQGVMGVIYFYTHPCFGRVAAFPAAPVHFPWGSIDLSIALSGLNLSIYPSS